MPSGSVDEVLEALDAVVDHAVRTGSRVGYFAAMYRTVTAKVKEGIEAGFFDDPQRMARLDVVFADRYLDALAAWQAGRRPTRSWERTFAAGRQWRPLVLQHLLAAVNAHINLDLGIATARTAPGGALPSLRRDFDRINEILGGLVGQVQDTLVAVSPWLGLLDGIGGRNQDEVVRFSLVVARTEAWRFATELAPLAVDQWAGPIRARDARVDRLAGVVLEPGALRAGLFAIRLRESNDVARVIRLLAATPGPSLSHVERAVTSEREGGPDPHRR
jgi:hypothetical protein